MNYNITLIDIFEDAGWDESQIAKATIVQRFMGTISLIGSSYVIQDVLRNERKRNHTFHRLMVGLSAADILSSFFVHILSTAAIPKGYQVFAVGNLATCDAQGFINRMCCFVTILYNCSLATYYLVQLKYNWINRRIKALEKWLHIVPWSVGLVMAVVGLALKSYGSYGLSCAVVRRPYPIGCSDPESAVECIRRPSLFWFFRLTAFGTMFLAMWYISVTMYMVYRSISDIEKQAHRYSFASYTRSHNNDPKRSRRVMLQGVLYSLGLFITFIFSIVQNFTGRLSYLLVMLVYTFWPLQGFFNALIYSIPVFQRIYKRWKENRIERQNALLQLKEPTNNENSKSHNTPFKNRQKQGAVSSNFGSGIPTPNSTNYINDNRESMIHNDPNGQLALMIDEAIEDKEANEEFDEEEVKEEIESNSETLVIHSGLIHDQFQLQRNDDSHIIDNVEGSSYDHNDNMNGCNVEIMEEQETQEGGNHGILHHARIDTSLQSEDITEGSIDNDDIDDDYILLSLEK